jgi:hypothetical protein
MALFALIFSMQLNLGLNSFLLFCLLEISEKLRETLFSNPQSRGTIVSLSALTFNSIERAAAQNKTL